jgi:hypothetical protein
MRSGGGGGGGRRVAVGNDLLSTVKMGLGGFGTRWKERDFVNCTAGRIFRQLHFNTNLYTKTACFFFLICFGSWSYISCGW